MKAKIFFALIAISALSGCGKNEPAPVIPKSHAYTVNVWLLDVTGKHIAERNQKVPPAVYRVIGGLTFQGTCVVTSGKADSSHDIYGIGGALNIFKGEAISCTAHQDEQSGFGIEMAITREDGTLVGNSRSVEPQGTIKVSGN